MSDAKRQQGKSWIWAILISVLIVNAGFLLADFRRSDWISNSWLSRDFTDHLGGEYDRIAKAIHSGRGFSDPFDRETGPTGWIPPVIPYCLSSLYAITGNDRRSVVLIVQLVQALALVVGLVLVLYPFRKHRWRWLFAIISLVAVAANFYYLFQFTHDHVVLMVLSTFVWLQFSYIRSPPRTLLAAVGLGIWGGIAALTSPVVGFAWGAMTAYRYRSSFKTVFVCGCVSLLITLPWVIYNSQRIGMFCPIKSNAAYELWQAQVADDDGIVDLALSSVHPFHGGNSEANIYDELGEAKYLQTKKQEWWESVRSDPIRASRHVLNRCVAAFIWNAPYSHRETGWSWALVAKRIWTIAVTLAILRLLFVSRTPLVTSALWVGLLYLTPYLLVSYYDRYDMAVFPLRLFLLLAAVETLLPRINEEGTFQEKPPTANPPELLVAVSPEEKPMNT